MVKRPANYERMENAIFAFYRFEKYKCAVSCYRFLVSLGWGGGGGGTLLYTFSAAYIAIPTSAFNSDVRNEIGRVIIHYIIKGDAGRISF